MNINTGTPHILLFERDQQLVSLLTNELQQVGYECHTARTAVEVFDAIARYPVRLVLVNLAQAAAARREFWVALDTQRRGRGVQVFTFHCTNIAGYGPSSEDTEERSHSVLADMEVDGMLGIMNMVNALRSRIAVSHPGAMSRPNTYGSSPQLGHATAPIPTISASSGNLSQGGKSSTNPSQPALSVPASSGRTSATTVNPTDKIRAVIYPNQRSWNSGRDSDSGNGQTPSKEQQPGQEINWSARNGQQGSINQPVPTSSSPTPPVAEPAVSSQTKRVLSDTPSSVESGLAQLSRMLRERHPSTLDELAEASPNPPDNPFQDDTALQQRVRPHDMPPISAMPLRASPIQDMPSERIVGGQGQGDTPPAINMKRTDEASYHAHQATPTLMSIATAAPATPASAQVVPPTPVLTVPPPPTVAPTIAPLPARTPTPTPRPSSTLEEAIDQLFVEATDTPDTPLSFSPTLNEPATQDTQDSDDDDTLIEHMQAFGSQNTAVTESSYKVPDNALLLDIVQSLPPMTSPPPPPQVLQGRATRSLGSVLLEGHLVPHNRLEVAQSIQRMLRGVDMNYQLGEILLMFKLLTPDQLLAASLVSYGLITTTQISALGRIRQELHSMGLEYDLENLLILFRILTSEQLREVRASWSG
jgi:hypothetical protein